MNAFLAALSRNCTTVGEVQDLLRNLLQADVVDFHYSNQSQPLRGDARSSDLVDHAVALSVIFTPVQDVQLKPSTVAPQRFQPMVMPGGPLSDDIIRARR